jgi:HlyD family secretion protein
MNMNWPGNYDEQAPRLRSATIDADEAVGPQGSALIHELTRLQRALDHRGGAEPEQFSGGGEPVQRRRHRNGRPARSGGRKRSSQSTVGQWLGLLGLSRSTAADRGRPQRSRDDAGVGLRRPANRVARELLPPAAGYLPQHTTMPVAARVAGPDTRQPQFPLPARVPNRNLVPRAQASAELSARARSNDGLRGLVGSGLGRLQTGCAFLIEGKRDAGMDETSGVEIATGLKRAYANELRIGLRVLILGLSVFGGWGVLVPLASSVVIPGTLVVKSSVKKIQHDKGGIVAQIPVHDGMHVHAGDVVLRLDETQLRAEYKVLLQQLDQERVRKARLVAERDDLPQPKMPAAIATQMSDPDVKQLWASEVSLFNSRAAARRSAKDLLSSRVGQLQQQISGLEAQVTSVGTQRGLISTELVGIETLFKKGLVPLARKSALERDASRLDGQRGQTMAAIAEAKSKISDTKLQIVRVDQEFRTEVMKDLRKAEDKESELVQKTAVVRDSLKRLDLRAPTSGIVQQLAVHTIGGVVAAREVIMEIVPESADLVVQAKLPPNDIDHVRIGQETHVRFSAFNQRTTPELKGVVSYVSPDLSHDERGQGQRGGAGFYTVQVRLPGEQRQRLGNLQLVSGMPAEVFLQTGTRTMLSYLLKPIADQLGRTFNQQ